MASPFASFSGKVYAITGLAGMGQSIARMLLQNGASVALADISQQTLDNAVAALTHEGDKSRIDTCRVDVGDWDQVEKWISGIVARFGRLDGAANFAGTIGQHHAMKELVEQDNSDWELIIRVNLTGMMHCVKAELQAMKLLQKAEKEPVSRSIVNAASIQGVKGFAKHVPYSTSKHGTIGLTRSVALEVAKDNIRVNCVAPGNTQTPLLDQALELTGGKLHMPHAIQRPGTADEVAQLTLFLLSDASQYITGAVYSVDGGWNC